MSSPRLWFNAVKAKDLREFGRDVLSFFMVTLFWTWFSEGKSICDSSSAESLVGRFNSSADIARRRFLCFLSFFFGRPRNCKKPPLCPLI